MYMCKHITDLNPPTWKHSSGEEVSDPKYMYTDPHQHMRKFYSESLTVSNSKLFCKACQKELSLKNCVVRLHLQSTKHKLGKEQLERQEK